MGLQFSTRLRPFARAWALDRLVLDWVRRRFRLGNPHFRSSGTLGTGRHVGVACLLPVPLS